MNTRDPASTDGAGNTGSTGEEVRPRIRRTHLALFVKDPFASASWYEEVLGMQVTARGARWVFLSFGQKHHDIALIQVDEPGLANIGEEIVTCHSLLSHGIVQYNAVMDEQDRVPFQDHARPMVIGGNAIEKC